jgi:hypothetical protein
VRAASTSPAAEYSASTPLSRRRRLDFTAWPVTSGRAGAARAAIAPANAILAVRQAEEERVSPSSRAGIRRRAMAPSLAPEAEAQAGAAPRNVLQ